MMRCEAPLLYWGPCCAGVYLMYVGAPGCLGSVLGCAAAIFLSTTSPRAVAVSAAVLVSSSSSGSAICGAHTQGVRSAGKVTTLDRWG